MVLESVPHKELKHEVCIIWNTRYSLAALRVLSYVREANGSSLSIQKHAEATEYVQTTGTRPQLNDVEVGAQIFILHGNLERDLVEMGRGYDARYLGRGRRTNQKYGHTIEAFEGTRLPHVFDWSTSKMFFHHWE